MTKFSWHLPVFVFTIMLLKERHNYVTTSMDSRLLGRHRWKASGGAWRSWRHSRRRRTSMWRLTWTRSFLTSGPGCGCGAGTWTERGRTSDSRGRRHSSPLLRPGSDNNTRRVRIMFILYLQRQQHTTCEDNVYIVLAAATTPDMWG